MKNHSPTGELIKKKKCGISIQLTIRNKKQQATDTCYSMDDESFKSILLNERNQMQRTAASFIIPFI